MEFSVKEKNLFILGTSFSPSIQLHCYSQFASIFTFISDYCIKLLLLKCVRYSEKKKLHVKIEVPELRESILHGTGRGVLLVHCIVLTVPISPQNPKTI